MSDTPPETVPPGPNHVEARYPDGGTETFINVTSFVEHDDKVVFFGELEPGGEYSKHTIYTGPGVRVTTSTVA